MKIVHVPRDGDGYLVPAKLVNWLVYSILAALLAIGGYMVVWNRSDTQWKTALMIRLESINEKIGGLEQKINVGILPRAEERMNAMDKRMDTLERNVERNR